MKRREILYIILISGLIPATWLLILTFLGIYSAILNVELSLNYLLSISSMFLGIFGYVGLLMLLKGLHKNNQIKKLIFLVCGLIGFLIFMTFLSPRNFSDWLFEYDFESIIGKFPIVVSLTFSVLIVNELIKNKTLTNSF